MANVTDGEKAPLVVAGITLSPLESKELQRVYAFFRKEDEIALQSLVYNTSNVGVQALYIANRKHLRMLAANPYLHAEMVLPLLRETKPDQIRFVLDHLFRNPVVVDNVNLFKIVFEQVINHYDDDMDMNIVFEGFLKVWGADPSNPHKKPMGVEVLLIVAAYTSSNIGMKVLLLRDRRAVNYNLEVRKDEIAGWIALNMPDFADLPLSWVLKAGVFYE